MQPNSKTALEDLVRDAGVKDTMSQPLIDSLREFTDTLWNREVDIEYKTLQELLAVELRKVKSAGPIQNPLLDMPGVSNMNIVLSPFRSVHLFAFRC